MSSDRDLRQKWTRREAIWGCLKMRDPKTDRSLTEIPNSSTLGVLKFETSQAKKALQTKRQASILQIGPHLSLNHPLSTQLFHPVATFCIYRTRSKARLKCLDSLSKKGWGLSFVKS